MVTVTRVDRSLSLFFESTVDILALQRGDGFIDLCINNVSLMPRRYFLSVMANRKVVSFPIVKYWLDPGRTGDYERAQEDVRSERIS